MKTQLLKSLVIVSLVATLSGTTFGQHGKHCQPNPYPVDPTPVGSYFLGVYTSKVLVNAYGGGQPVPPPQYGPLSQSRVGVRVAPGAGQDVYGMRINRIVPNSPAQYAGLEPGDIILDANGYPMDSRNDLQYAINTSQGILEMKVLDGRTGRLVWVVAQTQTQDITPAFAAQVRTRRHQANAKTQTFNAPRQAKKKAQTPPAPQPYRQAVQMFQSTIRRAPIRRGQR